jgi:hypothetical protein
MSLSSKYPVRNTDPAFGVLDVTPNDSADLKADGTASRGVYCGTSGDLAVVMADGTSSTLPNVAAGVTHPWRVVRVKATGTTASGIRAFF